MITDHSRLNYSVTFAMKLVVARGKMFKEPNRKYFAAFKNDANDVKLNLRYFLLKK